MKITPLLMRIFVFLPTAYSHATAMDQSGQSILAFLEDNNYLEASVSFVSPEVSGQARNRPD